MRSAATGNATYRRRTCGGLSFCRDCLADASPQAARCPACGSPRLIRHDELATLSIAHVDCDAFYATIEKRDDPALAAEPVIVGGGRRGVVAAACYVARTYGIRSAMPMYEALRLCPHAKVVRPNMEKYSKAGREVRAMMLALTPLVEPLSIDEAFLDLAGTERLHGMWPAKALARFAAEVEKTLRITVSIGLACNKFLAKIASDLDKPRGFAVLGGSEAAAFLAPKPVELHLRRRQGQHGAARPRRFSSHRRSAAGQRDRALPPLRRGRPPPGAARPRPRRPHGERRSRNQERVLGNHVRARSVGFSRAGKNPLGPDRGSLGAPESQGACRRDGDAKTQNRGFQNSHPGAFARTRRRNSPAASSPPRATCSSARPTARASG